MSALRISVPFRSPGPRGDEGVGVLLPDLDARTLSVYTKNTNAFSHCVHS